MNTKIVSILALFVVVLSGCTSSAAVITTDRELRVAEVYVEGMTCTSCAVGVEYQLKKVPGVVAADVNYPEGDGYVIYDPAQTNADQAVAASTVYRAIVVNDKPYED